MKSKGFTLIELLAIIVILAIIATITTPIILNIVEESKIKAINASAYGYKDSLNKYYLMRFKDEKTFTFNGRYTINSDGSLTQDDQTIIPEINGNIPNGGYLNMANNIIITGCIQFDEYSVIIENGVMAKSKKENC